MKKNFNKVLVTSLVLGLFATSTVYGAAISKTLKAFYRDIKIYVNDVQIDPKDQNGNSVEPFIVNDSTYLPLRAISEVTGNAVIWEDKTSSIKINSKVKYPIDYLYGDFGLYSMYIDGSRMTIQEKIATKPVFSVFRNKTDSRDNYFFVTMTDEQYNLQKNNDRFDHMRDGKLLIQYNSQDGNRIILDTRNISEVNGYKLEGIDEVTNVSGDEVFFSSYAKSESGTDYFYYEYKINLKTYKITVLNYTPSKDDESKYTASTKQDFINKQISNQQLAVNNYKAPESSILKPEDGGLYIEYLTGDKAGKKELIYDRPVSQALKSSDDLYCVLTVNDEILKKYKNGGFGESGMYFEDYTVLQIIDKNGTVKKDFIDIPNRRITLISFDGKTIEYSTTIKESASRSGFFNYSINTDTGKITVLSFSSEIMSLGHFYGDITEYNKYNAERVAEEQERIDKGLN